MAKDQEYRCAICRRTEEETKRMFHADHNHETGKLRGLLCSDCNTGIGLLRENEEVLTAAIEYLRKHA